MAKIFYDHLIIIEEVIAVLDSRKLTASERTELLSLIDQTLHQHILDEILTLLPESHHAEFLKMFHTRPDDPKLMAYLRDHAHTDADKAIMNRAIEIKKDLIKIIQQQKVG